MAKRKGGERQGGGGRGEATGGGRQARRSGEGQAEGREHPSEKVKAQEVKAEEPTTDGGGEPKLSPIATPIGNLGDLSPRASQVLEEADFWLVEDTRVSAKLAFHLGLKKPMRLLNEHTGPEAIARYVAEIASGKHAALLTDGGAPGISDPGALLTDAAHKEGIPVDPIPGPSAPIAALMASGFFAQRFVFLGFLPRKAGEVRRELEPFVESSATLVLFESPYRIDELLKRLHEVFGERRYALCREMTKLHSQVFRADLPIIPSEAEVPRRGEFTVVVEGLRKGPRRTSRTS